MIVELPSNWVLCHLEDVACWGSGGTPSRTNPAYFNGEIPWIKTGELGEMYLRNAEEKISDEAIRNSSAKVFPKGSVAIAMYGATIGKASILAIDAATNQACAVAQPLPGLLTSEYLYYFLTSQLRGFVEAGKGGAQPNISQGIIKAWSFPLPPFNEQRRVVAKIEELFSELDKGVESLTTAREQLKAYRQSVLKAAFKGKLTADWRAKNTVRAAQWQTVPISKIGDVGTGNTPSTKNSGYHDGDIPFFKPTDLDAGYQVKSSRSHLSAEGLAVARPFPANTVLVTCIGATIGKTGLARTAGACNQQINFVVPAENIDPRYVFFQIISAEFQEKIIQSSSSTTLPIINKGKFSQLPFKLCSPAEQAEVVRLVEENLEAADVMGAEIEAGLGRANALRQSVLKRAFSGQLVAQDPTDEPASVILERIRAQGEEGGAIKRRNNKNGNKEAA